METPNVNDREEMMRASRENMGEAWRNFQRLSSSKSDHLFCFTEGKNDRHYYPFRIRQVIGDKYIFLPCGDKKSVIKIHKAASKNTPICRLAFFIDLDFDSSYAPNFLPSLPFFETECYSIENYYVTDSAFKEILKGYFHKHEYDSDFDEIIQLFIDKRAAFMQAILEYNAWLACVIEQINVSNHNYKVDKKDNMAGIINFNTNDANISVLYTIESLNIANPQVVPIISEAQVRRKITELQSKGLTCALMGKFLTFFLQNFIKYLSARYNLKSPLGNIGGDNLLQIFSIYAHTPKKLTDYLRAL